MSYEIIYKKQFIKAVKENKTVYVPMIEAGSSNCFEVVTNRRSRNWFCDTNILNGGYYGTKEEMLNNAEKFKQALIDRNTEYKKEYNDWDTYNDKSFGWFAGIAIGVANTAKTTFGQYKGIYSDGCKKAVTVEELKQAGINTYIYVYTFDREDFIAKTGIAPFRIRVETSDELIRVIDEKNAILKPFGSQISITFEGWDGGFKKLRKLFINKKTTTKIESVEVNEVFVLSNGVGYFVKYTKNGYKYSHYLMNAVKKFFTEIEAEKFREKMRSGDQWTVIRLETNTTLERRVKVKELV
jgi:hypothetical protein